MLPRRSTVRMHGRRYLEKGIVHELYRPVRRLLCRVVAVGCGDFPRVSRGRLSSPFHQEPSVSATVSLQAFPYRSGEHAVADRYKKSQVTPCHCPNERRCQMLRQGADPTLDVVEASSGIPLQVLVNDNDAVL